MNSESTVLLVFLALTAVGVLIWVLSLVFWRRRVEQAPKEERDGAPTPREVGRLLLGVGIAIWVLTLLIWTESLQLQLKKMDNALTARVSVLSEQTREDYISLKNKVQDQAQPFSSFEYWPEELDLENRTVLYTFSATAKRYAVNASVSLRFRDHSLLLSRSEHEDSFLAQMRVPFDELGSMNAGSLILSGSGGEKTQNVYLNFNISGVFPTVSCDGTGVLKDGTTTAISVSLTTDQAFSRVSSMSMRLVSEDGAVQEWDLTDRLCDLGDGRYSLMENFLLNTPIPEGRKAQLTVFCTDQMGLRYEKIALVYVGGSRWSAYSSHVYSFEAQPFSDLGTLTIRDPEGSVLLSHQQ